MKTKCYHGIRAGSPQCFYFLRFGRPVPHRREIAKYGDFRSFRPRMALGTCRNLGRRQKTEKHNFPVLGTPLGEICLPQQFLPANAFYLSHFGRPDPHRWEFAKYGGFGIFWPRTALGTGVGAGRKRKNTISWCYGHFWAKSTAAPKFDP